MKRLLAVVIGLALASTLWAADVTFEGTYTTTFKNDRPNTLNGTVTSDDNKTWTGELKTDWKGKIESYKGTITGDLKSGPVKGDFTMAGSGRHFLFDGTAADSVITAKCVEVKGSKTNPVGDITIKPAAAPADPAK